jgi:hypothetical protein
MKRSLYLALFSLLFCFTAEAQSAKPNILLILTDDLGYHDVSYYGTKDLTSRVKNSCLLN